MWIFFALSAAALWGLTYAINEQVYKRISVVTSLGVTGMIASIALLLIAYFGGFLKQDVAGILNSKSLIYLVIGESIVLTLAELAIGFSIVQTNATLAGLIEISYPIFIILFAYLIFNENHLSPGLIVGGIMIFLGVVVIQVFRA